MVDANTEHQDQELIDAFRVLRIELRIVNDRVAAAAGIKPRDLDLLDVIDREGACTPGHLAARTGMRAATLTGVLARLEDDGWITRSTDPKDGRSARVASTERFEQVRSLYQDAGGSVQRVFNDVVPEYRSAVMWYLRTLAYSLRDMSADIPSALT
ncbi:MarR family winged helix-turn-helix transcriptional regulator [Antrihabitans cavernicola]|uniref:MarR family winged helix-turn-helix transcriptional regulator n=1 Tax=Antrihabitans cavernicola TaxID=2495913 RepID=UPI001659E045|nr:MarR family transcriptional regulator [Spelaeibacter cavernicola]